MRARAATEHNCDTCCNGAARRWGSTEGPRSSKRSDSEVEELWVFRVAAVVLAVVGIGLAILFQHENIAFLNSFNPASPVSDVAHLGGMIFGYAFLKMPAVRGWNPLDAVNEAYRQWKLARAKKKFQVYMRKQKSDRDRYVN